MANCFGTVALVGALICPVILAADGLPQGFRFGDDSGQATRDGECDDRRFFGPGMADELAYSEMTRDATDCQTAYDSGLVRLWIAADAIAATQCKAIDFGDDTGDYTLDGACDDPRFEGFGSAEILQSDDFGHDASDCQRLCDYGLIGLRDY